MLGKLLCITLNIGLIFGINGKPGINWITMHKDLIWFQPNFQHYK